MNYWNGDIRWAKIGITSIVQDLAARLPTNFFSNKVCPVDKNKISNFENTFLHQWSNCFNVPTETIKAPCFVTISGTLCEYTMLKLSNKCGNAFPKDEKHVNNIMQLLFVLWEGIPLYITYLMNILYITIGTRICYLWSL